jgi:FMN reductase [NAD(P)H]
LLFGGPAASSARQERIDFAGGSWKISAGARDPREAVSPGTSGSGQLTVLGRSGYHQRESTMEAFECIFGRRTCRRFKQDPISQEDLGRIVDAARYAPTGFNHQSLRFVVIRSPEKVAEAFGFTGWLTGRPPEGQRPTAFIVVLNDSEVGVDTMGAHCATQNVMLAAWALGYGSCIHGMNGNEKFKAFLGLPEKYVPQVLLSLGRPDETFDVQDGSSEWKVSKDEAGVVHLGKFSREDVTVCEL